jgi:predicted acyl esterase
LSGLWGIPQSGFGLPVDQHDDDTRAATLDSAPLETDFLLCGRSEVRLKLADDTDAAPERVVVRLAAVDADDRSTFITLGVLCPTGAAEVYRVVLRATAYRVPAGSRLRIVVSDSDFPRLRPLAHPRPLSIVGVELTAPAVPDAAGAAIDVPIIAGPLAPRRHWTITRDHIDDSIDIAIGWSSQATTSEGHRVERKTALRAHTRRSAPEAAVFTGDHAAVVEFSDGTPVDVTAAVRCTQTWLWVRGTVRVDGTTVYTHTWDEPLGAGDA